MKYDPNHRSSNVEDRRGQRRRSTGGSGGGAAGVMLLIRLFKIALGFGVPGVIVFFVGLVCAGAIGGAGLLSGVVVPRGVETEEMAVFTGFVLDDAQAVWAKEFADDGGRYKPAKLVLFTESTPSGCGEGLASTGPFYCPADEKVYIDLSFYGALQSRFGVSGNFAQAYVIAHEIGHHVQHLQPKRERHTKGADGSAVRSELQADCYAGIWAGKAKAEGLLEAGDIEGALAAAQAIGDDRLQKQSRGYVTPETFGHGTSEQRSRWFQVGFNQGTIEACDTFSAAEL